MDANSTRPLVFGVRLGSLALLAVLAAGPAQGATFTVNSAGDTPDTNIGNGTCADAGGFCTLRAALQEANFTVAADTINFNIGGGGLQTITLTAALPVITQPVSLDGTTQPGFLPAALPIIELNGAGGGFSGLSLGAGSDGSTIRGFVINRCGPAGAGILIRASWNNVVAGNFLGTNPAGTAPGPGNSYGIYIGGGTGVQTNNNRVGGTVAADRNIISGNTVDGVDISGGNGGTTSTANNLIEGNYIGTDVTGTLAVANTAQGVAVFNNGAGGSNTNDVIGVPGAGNVISGNGGMGVVIRDPQTTGTLVQGNKIGTDYLGTAGLGNGGAGIEINATTANNTIGGTAAGAGNVIAYNNYKNIAGLGGIAFLAGTGNAILQNSIHSNTRLGIDLNEDGVTANDALDADAGPNNLINFPSFPSPVVNAGVLSITFGLDVPAGFYRVEFFKNPSGADASLHGEGQVFASAVVVSHPGGGTVAYSHSFPGVAGDVITATTTACLDGTAACTTPGSTSEFSIAAAAVTTAVKLMSFTAVARDRAVELLWQTGSELDNLGFHLYRSLSASGPWTRLTKGLIPGLGSSPLGKSYSFLDSGLTNGTRYYYRLDDVDTSSRATSHGPISAIPTAAASADGDGASGKKKSASPPSCPAWVVAAYGSVAGSSSAALTCTRHGDPEAVSLAVVSRDSRSAVLELETGGFYALHTLSGAGEASGRVRVFVPGFDFPQDPQAPALPFRRALVDAVVGRRVQLGAVRALDQVGFPGLVPMALGKAEMQVSRDGTVRAGRRALPESSPQQASIELARLQPSVFQGETKSAVVVLTPLRYDSRRQQIVLSKRLLVRLLFTGRETGESGRGSVGRRERPQKPVAGELLARLYTTSRGLYAASFDRLFSGTSRGFAASQLRLERQGQAQGFHIEPAGDIFGPGSVLYFHADAVVSSTDFSPEAAWELFRARDGVQMPLVPAAPSGAALTTASTGRASFESDGIYQPGLLEAPDVWLWDYLSSGVTRAKSFSLGGVNAASSQAAALEVFLQGASESGNAIDHHVSVSVNGTLAGEAQFAGKKPYRISLSVPASLLHEGANELSLTNVADTGVSSLVFLDRFTVSYPQASSLAGGVFEGTWAESGTATVSGTAAAVLDVTASSAAGSSPTTPTSSASWLGGYQGTGGRLRFRAEAGHRYLAVSQQALLSPRVALPAPSTLRSAQNQADYVLIAPRAFLAVAEPLVARRQGQGLAARAVAFEEIADEFGHGQPSAEAIKAFLAFAYQSWARPSPHYVLLLGDSTYDPRNFMGSSLSSPLPALWVKTSYLWTASDPELAAVNGDDELPDLAIGRLPAATVDEAQVLVDKLIAWEESGQGLTGAAVLVADNPDLGGDFEANARDIARSFLAGRCELLLLSELGAETRPRIQAALDSGLSYLSYLGHGGAAVWASENVWNSWDAASLQAQSRQPLVVTMDCLNGYFVAPTFDSLAESLLKAEGRGAIAAFSPSGLSLDGPAHEYDRALMAELTGGQHERLGDAVLAAQKAYAQTGLMPELLSVYHLLGDPATRIR